MKGAASLEAEISPTNSHIGHTWFTTQVCGYLQTETTQNRHQVTSGPNSTCPHNIRKLSPATEICLTSLKSQLWVLHWEDIHPTLERSLSLRKPWEVAGGQVPTEWKALPGNTTGDGWILKKDHGKTPA